MRDLIAVRVQRALQQRVRYRYVQPTVTRLGDGFHIESPCCSRNVVPDGGVIDIALLLPPGARGPSTVDGLGDVASWRLYERNHTCAFWVLHEQAGQVDELLDLLCLDARRVFWP